MKRLFGILFLLACGFQVQATSEDRGDPKYPVADIDEALLENAWVVVRKRDLTFTVIGREKTRFREHVVYTIVNEKAESMAMIYEFYNPLTKITAFEAVVYDKHGEEIDKLRKSDINDQSAVSGASLYEDNRVQFADMSQPDYPYTVEFITEKEVDKYYEVYDLYPVFRSNMSVQSSSLSLVGPEELLPRYKEHNFDGERQEFHVPEGIKLYWEVSNLKAVETEPYSSGLKDFMPYVDAAPSRFAYAGYEGDMNTWENFGKWIWKINAGRDELPPNVVEEVKKLTAGLSDREKARVVYEFMQNRTRYVNISLGIGALQPFEASVVNNVGYGDCKALSNYTVSLLREVGVDAYYTLIQAGPYPEKLDPDFPKHAFNHAVVSIPMEKDTVWLECTSQTNPFNHTGTFTSNREALMITPEGGVIVKTPRYTLKDNERVKNVKVTFDEAGNARVNAVASYQGIHYDLNGLSFHLHYGKEDQKKWLHKNIDVPNLTLNDFSVENIKSENPEARIEVNFDVVKYASKTGKRFYFAPNMLSHIESKLRRMENRKSDFILSYDLAYVDTIEYEFPSSYQVEYLPETLSEESEFGRYEARVEFVQGRLVYTRRLEMFSGEYPPSRYQDYIDFVKKIESLDDTKVVFTTKT